MRRTSLSVVLVSLAFMGVASSASAAEIAPTNRCAQLLRAETAKYPNFSSSNSTDWQQAVAKTAAETLFASGCISDPEPLYEPKFLAPASEVRAIVDSATRWTKPFAAKARRVDQAADRTSKAIYSGAPDRLEQKIEDLKFTGQTKRIRALKKKVRGYYIRNRKAEKRAKAFWSSDYAYKFGLVQLELYAVRAITPLDMPDGEPGSAWVDRYYGLNFDWILYAVKDVPFLPSYDTRPT